MKKHNNPATEPSGEPGGIVGFNPDDVRHLLSSETQIAEKGGGINPLTKSRMCDRKKGRKRGAFLCK